MRGTWTSQHFDRALAMLREGKSVAVIAEALNVPRSSATTKFKPYLRRRKIR